MERKLERIDSDIKFNQNHKIPGCLWPLGILQMIEYYQQRDNVKKSSPRVKLGRRKRNIRYGNPKTVSLDHHGEEVDSYLLAEATTLTAEPEAATVSSENEMKELSDIQMSEKSRLRRARAFHHLDLSGDVHCGTHEADANVEHDLKESQKITDVVEIFDVDKNLFFHVLNDQEPNRPAAKFMLMKSGSFPSLDSSRNQLVRPRSMPEHKQIEMWTSPVGKMLAIKATSSKVDEDSEVSSQASLQEINKHGWHVPFTSYIEGIKKKLKKAIKEHKKVNHQTAADHSETNSFCSVDEQNNREDVVRIRRASSLDESIDRYTRLFESSSSPSSERKWHEYRSKSLRLTNEYKFPSGSNNNDSVKFLRRKLSLPDLDSFIPPLPVSTVDYDANENETNMVSTAVKNDADAADDADASVISSEEKKLDSVLQNSACDHDTSIVMDELPVYEESDASRNICIEAAESAVDALELDSWTGSCSNPKTGNVKGKTAFVDDHPLHFDVVRLEDNEDDDFNYVRYVLETSGFTEQKDNLRAWYSIERPMSPALFKQLEANYSSNMDNDNYDHQLLFDLTNEVLLEVQEDCLAYFPKCFSFSSRCAPPLTQASHHVIPKLWNRIGAYRCLTSKKDVSLEDILVSDLVSHGWTNLRMESEDVALDVEDVIFDQLLDEILFCL